jgi:hypothetical protein
MSCGLHVTEGGTLDLACTWAQAPVQLLLVTEPWQLTTRPLPSLQHPGSQQAAHGVPKEGTSKLLALCQRVAYLATGTASSATQRPIDSEGEHHVQ